MDIEYQLSDDELPDLRTFLLPHHKPKTSHTQPLRRSPRKNTNATLQKKTSNIDTPITLSATSSQRRTSPVKNPPSKHSPLKTLPQARTKSSIFEDVPVLPRKAQTNLAISPVNDPLLFNRARRPEDIVGADLLLVPTSGLENDNRASRLTKVTLNLSDSSTTFTMSTAKSAARTSSVRRVNRELQRASRFVLDEARCDEDLVDSDAQDGDEEDDTDLSGFIVDDDAEISYHESSDGNDSEEERRAKRTLQKDKPRRRLQRGRRKVEDSEDEMDGSEDLEGALNKLSLHGGEDEHKQAPEIEVIDLISPEAKSPEIVQSKNEPSSDLPSVGTNLFEKFKALKLSPPRGSRPLGIPSKVQPMIRSSSPRVTEEAENQSQEQFVTPPVTPPRSPTKLKSPSKLLSPSKRGDGAMPSPHRQSMDAFWDLNEVNEWNDHFSPKKAPVTSLRKNRLAYFNLWSDAEDDSFEAINETLDSLPSPCESPSKPKARVTSPVKAEKQRLQAEKKAREVEKKTFEKKRDQMALDLLHALDKNVTGSKISKLAASTGGVKLVWSKTLRSTAGRANWRRTVTKPTGSPVKNKAEESVSGATVQHFANIELAIKVIDRPDRLINTLAHEFCHLANFMISGIRDQPHGASFQSWARKVTTWMKSQNDVSDWKMVEVTTKHGYVIEWKYLWVCVGREQNKAMEFLNIDDEDGCGAEYGRHSKSIDTDKHRCGRCKGTLIQVRPKPRASPVKKSERKQPLRGKGSGKGVDVLEKMIEVIDLSD